MNFLVLFALFLQCVFAQMPNSTDIVIYDYVGPIVPGAFIYINGTASSSSLTCTNTLSESVNVIVNGVTVWPDLAPNVTTPYLDVMIPGAGLNNITVTYMNGSIASALPGFGIGGYGGFMNFTIPTLFEGIANIDFTIVFVNGMNSLSGSCANYGVNGQPNYGCQLNVVANSSQIIPAGYSSMSLVITRPTDNALIAMLPFPQPVFFQAYFSTISAENANLIYDGTTMTIEGGFVPTYLYACQFQFLNNNLSLLYSANTTFQNLSSPIQFSCSIPSGTWSSVQQACAFTVTVLQQDEFGNVTALVQGNNNVAPQFYYQETPKSTTTGTTTGNHGGGKIDKKTIIIICGVVGGAFVVGVVVSVVVIYSIRRRKYTPL